MPADDLTEVIEALAAAPQSVEVDGQKVTEHSLTEVLEAQKRLANQEGVRKAHRGVRFTKLIPPGTV